MSIDWGKKRIWIAYVTTSSSIIFPVWSLDNNADMLYGLAHIVTEHKINTIIVWYPSQQSFVTKSIDTFIKNLSFVIDPEIVIKKVNEDYSSVQAGAQLGNFKKTAAEDTLAAAVLLENYIKTLW